MPVELAKEMGADIIIAVDASTPLEKKQRVSSVTAVMGQMVAILTDRNLVESKKQLGPQDILINVELGELSAVCTDGTCIPIILDGRFVLPGTEALNEAFT